MTIISKLLLVALFCFIESSHCFLIKVEEGDYSEIENKFNSIDKESEYVLIYQCKGGQPDENRFIFNISEKVSLLKIAGDITEELPIKTDLTFKSLDVNKTVDFQLICEYDSGNEFWFVAYYQEGIRKVGFVGQKFPTTITNEKLNFLSPFVKIIKSEI